MFSKYRVLPYKAGSHGARMLAEAINGRRIRFSGAYTPRFGHVIINWGNPRRPGWMLPDGQTGPVLVLNHPDKIANANNKLTAFQIMHAAGVKVPEFTVHDWQTGRAWAIADGVAVARNMLRASGGRGIELMRRENMDNTEYVRGMFAHTPLFVRYIKKTDEYRVHVVNDNVIDVQRKMKRNGVEADYQIRNHSNGWVFGREGVQPPPEVIAEAKAAVSAFDLQFGAVDVIWNRNRGAYVLEVNTAPGIEGSTVQSYKRAFEEY